MLAVAKAPWKSGVAGMFTIVLAFLISIVNPSKDTPSQFVGLTLQPFILSVSGCCCVTLASMFTH